MRKNRMDRMGMKLTKTELEIMMQRDKVPQTLRSVIRGWKIAVRTFMEFYINKEKIRDWKEGDEFITCHGGSWRHWRFKVFPDGKIDAEKVAEIEIK